MSRGVEHHDVEAAFGRLIRIAHRNSSVEASMLEVGAACFDGLRILLDCDQQARARRELHGEVADAAVQLEHTRPLGLGEIDDGAHQKWIDPVVRLKKAACGTVHRTGFRFDDDLRLSPRGGKPRAGGTKRDPRDPRAFRQRITRLVEPGGLVVPRVEAHDGSISARQMKLDFAGATQRRCKTCSRFPPCGSQWLRQDQALVDVDDALGVKRAVAHGVAVPRQPRPAAVSEVGRRFDPFGLGLAGTWQPTASLEQKAELDLALQLGPSRHQRTSAAS
ncbi:MAG: hypothetical protein AMJ62_13450 [Myxococcales bacterium SG8_38]|nr:MAG: hypothetical protein AMJ62_13450 [Myxococcales bacterium SG8_38]